MRAALLSLLLPLVVSAAVSDTESCDGGIGNLTTGAEAKENIDDQNLSEEERYYKSLPFDPFDRSVTVDTINFVPDLVEAHIRTLIMS